MFVWQKLAISVLAVGLAACAEPPGPLPVAAPAGVPRWSTTTQVRWTGPADPISSPLAVFVDTAGGPLDRIAADPDVTTFLNDRFAPWFLTPEAAAGLPEMPAAYWLDARGCLLAGPARPTSPAAWIDLANAVVMRGEKPGRYGIHPAPTGWVFDLPTGHPLRADCAANH